MIAILRFIGILNAAVWFGAAVFFTFAGAPAVFAPEMKRIFGNAHVGIMAQSILERFFILQYCCGGIALVHQLTERFYLGKAFHKFTLGLLLTLLGLGLIGGLGLQPRLQH